MNRFFFFLPLMFCVLGCQSEDPLQVLKREIEALINTQPGTYALAFKGVDSPEQTIFINEKESFHAASTMKTPVMIEIFKQANAGRFQLSDSILIKNEFYSIVDSSTYQMQVGVDSEKKLYQLIGEKSTIFDLTHDMITYSSDLATNILIDLVDARKVTKSMRALGAYNIEVLRGVEDLKAFNKGLSNSTTAFDLMIIFEALAKGSVVSPEACQQMIEILLKQHFNEIIPAELPKNVKVAHKTGWISTANHDSGLVILPDGKQYILILLSKNWESEEASTELMAEISKKIYDYYSNL